MKVSQQGSTAGRFDQVFQMASEATGTSFEYLLATAKRESSLRPDLKAATSSATGLFQFVEQTWLTMVKEEGADLGLSSFADAITVDARGKATVADPAVRQQILELRKDPTLSAVMAGRLTQKNAGQLERTLGRPPTEGELYIAHFMGAAGGGRLIEMASQDPLRSAADAFPTAAQANRAIFFDKTGRARGAAEVYTELVARHPDQVRQLASTAKPAPAGAEVAASRVAVAFSALPEGALELARQPLAPGFDGFRSKARAEPFTARTASAADPFRAVLKPDAAAPLATDAPPSPPLGYSPTPAATPAAPTAVPLAPSLAAPAPTPVPAGQEVRRSRLVTDPASWGADRARPTAAPRTRTPVAAGTHATQPVATPRPPLPTFKPIEATAAAAATTTGAASTAAPQTAGITATATGPAHANRGTTRAPEAAVQGPLDLTGFLSYRVHREPKDLLPPL